LKRPSAPYKQVRHRGQLHHTARKPEERAFVQHLWATLAPTFIHERASLTACKEGVANP
jgi:hypothetical protein